MARGNAELAERKRAARAAEAQEAQAIAQYVRQRDAREQVGGRLCEGLGEACAPVQAFSHQCPLPHLDFKPRLSLAGPILPPPAPPAPACLQELAEERERIARAKELEVARLRAMQEKIIDNRSALVGPCAGSGGWAPASGRCSQRHVFRLGLLASCPPCHACLPTAPFAPLQVPATSRLL